MTSMADPKHRCVFSTFYTTLRFCISQSDTLYNCWKKLVIMTKIVSDSGSRLRTHNCKQEISFTMCLVQYTPLTVDRAEHPKLQKCPDDRLYVVSTSHSPPALQTESHRFLCKAMTGPPPPPPQATVPIIQLAAISFSNALYFCFYFYSGVPSDISLPLLRLRGVKASHLLEATDFLVHLAFTLVSLSALKILSIHSLLLAAEPRFSTLEQEDVSGIQHPVS